MSFNWLKKFKDDILDLLFPKECLNCRRAGIYLCADCQRQIKINQQDVCPVCKNKSAYGRTHAWCRQATNLDGVIVAVEQTNNIVKKAIHYFKYAFVQELKADLARLLINKIIQLDRQKTQPNWLRLLLGNDNLIIVPVPLHKRRLRWRGFNQSELLAKEVCQKLNLPWQTNLLQRIKYTTPQVKLKRRKRLKNIRRAFRVSREWQDKLAESKIILIDDVATTTGTLNECARVLKKHGALEVWGIVLERG